MAGLMQIHPGWMSGTTGSELTYPTAEELWGRPRPRTTQYAGLPLPALLAALRKSRDWTQMELAAAAAERVGVNSVGIGAYETGQKVPRLSMLAAIAEALELDREERIALITAAGYPIERAGR